MPSLSVPVLASASGPILEFERRILDSMTEIEHWFRQNWQEHTPPFYGSVDLRNAGFKLAPVDMNLFPGGFNNLSEDALPCAVQAAQVAIERTCPDARKLLLIPERHTRNVYYLQNVARLVRLLGTPGLEVRIGTLSDEVTRPTSISLPGGERLTIEPVIRQGDRVGLEGFDPCIVLLNNDLSAGVPPQLIGLDPAQTLLPPLHAGWAVRRKSNFFKCYDEVAEQFAQLIGVDPWTINPLFERCGRIDFREKAGEECLADKVDQLLGQIRERYRERDIRQKPFAIVKPDAGTYGMGIMTVRDASDVVGLNRKERNKMAVVKEGLEVSEVILQEGVPTFETIDQAVAEPVVYMVDRYVVGGFYRVHRQRGIDENLNAPGMQFAPLAFANACNLPNREAAPGSSAQNRFYCYGVVGRLALLAASIELERTALASTALPRAEGLLSALPREVGEGSGVRVGAEP
ncbi:MAG TPA: glutamate--cysteine ligase [Burkholderiaceae bacterium]|nr:glutamate--cysteine ligase [Burkholderiaceae bacterium]